MNIRSRIAAAARAYGELLGAVLPGPGGHSVQVNTDLAARKYERGQGNLIGLFIGITIATIVGVGVVIPLMNDQMQSTTFQNSMTETVVGYIPLFVGLLLLVGVAAPMMRSL